MTEAATQTVFEELFAKPVEPSKTAQKEAQQVEHVSLAEIDSFPGISGLLC